MSVFSSTNTSINILARIQEYLLSYQNAKKAIEKTLASPFHNISDVHVNDSIEIYEDETGSKYVNSCDCYDSNTFVKYNNMSERIYIELFDSDAKKYGGKVIYKLKSGVLPVGGIEMDFIDAINNPSITCTTSITTTGNNYLLNFWDPSGLKIRFTTFIAISNTVDNVGFPWDETSDFKPHVPNNNNVRFTIGALAYEISCRKDDPNKPFERVNWNNNVDTDIDILLRKLNTDIVKVFCRFGNPPNA